MTPRLLLADDYTQLGWPATLSNLYKNLDAKPKNYVILISRVPTITVDFRSEEGLRNSINSFTFQSKFHPGHEMVGWKCNLGGTKFESIIGLTGESDDQHLDLLKSGWGLTSLLATFKDGFVQTPDEIENRFKFFKEENENASAMGEPQKISLLSTVIEVTESDCENVVNEVFEFMNHPNKPTENFSMILSPNKYEGAGCGSFATHFIERIESLKPIVDLFRRRYQFSNYIFGTGAALPIDVEIPKNISTLAVKHPVSKVKLITSAWTSTTSPSVDLEITDPELIVFWQKLFFESYFEKNSLKKEKRNFSKIWHRGHWETVPDLNEAGYTKNQYVVVDKNYDEKTQHIANHFKKMVQDSELTYFTFLNFPGIILEKK